MGGKPGDEASQSKLYMHCPYHMQLSAPWEQLFITSFLLVWLRGDMAGHSYATYWSIVESCMIYMYGLLMRS